MTAFGEIPPCPSTACLDFGCVRPASECPFGFESDIPSDVSEAPPCLGDVAGPVGPEERSQRHTPTGSSIDRGLQPSEERVALSTHGGQ